VIYLLDVNMLIAAIWQDHEDQLRVEAWLGGKQTATCPISELGFCGSAAATRFHFGPNSSLAEWLFRNLSGNIAAGLSRTIFHRKGLPPNQADNSPICILPNWPRDIE
jgi:hypothetical protein